MSKTCKVEGCNGKHKGHGYCGKHLFQVRKYGHILEKTIRTLNEIIEYEDYAEIILYNKGKEEVCRAIIDLDDIEKVNRYKWGLSKGYATNWQVGLLHRYIMNCPDNMVVDHINHNRLDNRKCNLRICTIQENGLNKKVSPNNKLGVKGVRKLGNKYQARISFNGKRIFIGSFDTLEEAQAAYNQKANELHGEFSLENSQEISNNNDLI